LDRDKIALLDDGLMTARSAIDQRLILIMPAYALQRTDIGAGMFYKGVSKVE
jgi:hypothetical protein